MFYGVILVIHIIVCFILIGVILLQAGRGGGLAETFGGGSTQSMLGTRGAAFLTRATGVFAAVFMLTSLTLAIFSVQRGKSLMEKASTLSVPIAIPQTEPAESSQPETERQEPSPSNPEEPTP